MPYCLDEALFFEERFERSLEFDLVLQSGPVVRDAIPVIWPHQVRMHQPPSQTAHGWHRPPSRAPPEFRV
jgi:hypothetical protein